MLDFAEITAALAPYKSVVLTVVEESGYPLSVRSTFWFEADIQVIRLNPPVELNIPEGNASLLCHSHDDALDNLRTLTIRGTLESIANGWGWIFHPTQIIPGLGMNGFWRDVVQGAIIGPRRSAKQYLQKHGLSRPEVPWDVLRKLTGE